MAQTITLIGPAGCDTVEIYSTAEGSRTTKIAERTMEVGEISGTLYQPVDWELSTSPVTLSNARYRVVLKAATVEALTDFVTITASSGDFVSEGYAAAADVDLSTLETKTEADARQTLLIAEHDATQAAVAAIDGLSSANVADIVQGVTAVTPRIRAAADGSYEIIAGNTWTQDVTLSADSADKYVVSIKSSKADVDADAVLFADSDTGLITLNGETADTASLVSVTYASGTITVVISSLATVLLTPGAYYLTVKALDVGADVTAANLSELTVIAGGVLETSAS